MNLLSYLRRGTTDVTTNTLMRDVIGSKVDAAAAVGTTKSLVAYVKYIIGQGVIQLANGRRCVEKSDGAVLTGLDALFTITGGPIIAKVVGIVTTVLGGAANGTLRMTTTDPAGVASISTTVAIDNDASGTSYRFVGATGVLTPVTQGSVIIDPVTVEDCEFLLPVGSVGFLGSAAQTGVIKWYMTYLPLSPNSVVVAAA